MTTTWRIINLKRQSSDDLVTNITYECKMTEGNDSNRKIGNIDIVGDANDPNFIPFTDLTEETILVWLFNELGTGKDAIELELSTFITERVSKRAARVHKNGTPWGRGGKGHPEL
jgi:hypothetical protein